jgi:hypothetical protein
MGDVVFAPLVLTLFSPTAREPIVRETMEFIALLALLVGIGVVVFGGTHILAADYPAPDYAVLPVLIWAALRFGILGYFFKYFRYLDHRVLGNGAGIRSVRVGQYRRESHRGSTLYVRRCDYRTRDRGREVGTRSGRTFAQS